MSRFMALDQSTTCTGYAIFEGNHLIESGLFKESSKDIMVRIEGIYNQILDKANEYNVKSFIFEDTFSTLNVKVTKTLCWLQGAIMSLAFTKDYGYVLYYPNSWRKILDFKRKSKKSNPQPNFKNNREYQKYQAIEYAKNNYDVCLTYGSKGDDDRAEAICIGHAYIKENKI